MSEHVKPLALRVPSTHATTRRARDGAAVVAHMKAAPADDDAFGHTVIRADGRAMVTPYLFEIKAPAESRGGWDFYKLVASTPADQAAPPAADCPLVRT